MKEFKKKKIKIWGKKTERANKKRTNMWAWVTQHDWDYYKKSKAFGLDLGPCA